VSRTLLWTLAIVLGVVAPVLRAQQPQENITRLILLGTAAGSSIKKARAHPANALVVNGSV